MNVTDELEVCGMLDGCVDISIDYAHAISKGLNKELYYLEIIAHWVEFTWGIPSQDWERPQIHLQQFMDLTGLCFRSIRHNDAAEFARSATFRAWAESVHAVLEQVAGYKHTLNWKAEGAVRIAKEHVRCLLRSANMQCRFWPWAVTHWHRTYNHWVKALGKLGWESLPDHRFSQDFARDLQPFGCYVSGHLSREHPLVGEDTMHADRGLGGAFLGWDLTTPTFWLWSFKLRKPVRLEGPRFKQHLYPFKDPCVLVDSHVLTMADVNALHAEDGPLDQLFDDDDLGELGSHQGEQGQEQGEQQASGVLKRRRSSRTGIPHSGELPDPVPDPDTSQRTVIEPLTAEGERERSARGGHGRKQYRWTDGRHVPANAKLALLTDDQLARALAHHQFVLPLPSSYWIYDNRYTASEVQVSKAKSQKGHAVVEVDVVAPKKARD